MDYPSIDTLDSQEFVDEKSGKHILFFFVDEHHLIIDVCNPKDEEHADCNSLQSLCIEL